MSASSPGTGSLDLEKRVGELEKANSFSFEETCIGTWVDGKPLYRKVIIQSANSFVNSESYTKHNIVHDIPNISRINKCYAYMQSGSTTYPLPYFDPNSGAAGTYIYEVNGTNIFIRNRDKWSNYNIVIVIEYTKTIN